MFNKLALVGIGLIGSSIARAVRDKGLARTIAISTRKQATLDEARALGLGDSYSLDPAEAVRGADLVILCTPVGAYGPVMEHIAAALEPGAILSDVGSVKQHVVDVIRPLLKPGVHFIPAHPIAGTEHSGPSAGFPELFVNRWCVLTPEPGVDPIAVDRLTSSSPATYRTSSPTISSARLPIWRRIPSPRSSNSRPRAFAILPASRRAIR
jgi:cyclohexadieny/prephenate dehydrogenase